MQSASRKILSLFWQRWRASNHDASRLPWLCLLAAYALSVCAWLCHALHWLGSNRKGMTMDRVIFAWAWLVFMLTILLGYAAFITGIAFVNPDGIGFLVPNIGGYFWQF
jgi:hypothetical protein